MKLAIAACLIVVTVVGFIIYMAYKYVQLVQAIVESGQ